MDWQRLIQQSVNGISVGSVYALLGLGVTLVWGVLRVLNFAHAQLLTWGAFGTAFGVNSGLPLPVAIILGAAVGGALAVVIDATVVTWLRQREAPEFAYVVATIGVAVILETVLKWRTNSQTERFPRDGFPTGRFLVGDISIPRLQVLVFVVSIVLMITLSVWLRQSRTGRSLRTVAYSPEIAALQGINTRASFALAFAISGVLAAVAGVFVATDTASISYSTGSPLLLVAFAAIILGGMGSVRGALVGGLVLGLAQTYATVYVSSIFRQAVAYLLIIAVLVLRPSGLFGEKETARV